MSACALIKWKPVSRSLQKNTFFDYIDTVCALIKWKPVSRSLQKNNNLESCSLLDSTKSSYCLIIKKTML